MASLHQKFPTAMSDRMSDRARIGVTSDPIIGATSQKESRPGAADKLCQLLDYCINPCLIA